MGQAEYIIEFIPQGRYVKVSAIDPITGTEAVMVGDPTQPQATLQRLAIQKLEYLLNKNK